MPGAAHMGSSGAPLLLRSLPGPPAAAAGADTSEPTEPRARSRRDLGLSTC